MMASDLDDLKVLLGLYEYGVFSVLAWLAV